MQEILAILDKVDVYIAKGDLVEHTISSKGIF